MMQADPRATALGDDAFFIEQSWAEPEQFAVLFGRNTPRIHRSLRSRPAPPGPADSDPVG